MILIYSDSSIIELEWLPKITFPDTVQISHDFIKYRDTVADTKIAFTMHRLHCDHDIDCDAYKGFEDKINHLSAISNYVFSFESELHDFHWQIWQQCHHDNVYWVVPGQVNDSPMSNNIIFWGDWFKTTTLLYKQLPNKLAELAPYTIKSRMFDALLGSPKPHRDFVYNAVQENNLQDKFIIPYGGKWNDNEFYAKDYFVWEPGVEVVGNQQPGTAGPVTYYGVDTGLSRVIPLNVFNDTAYSIIAETDHDNTLSFFSEKTAKPMIARRLFIVFSGYKFLQNLRAQGFCTFGDMIDESYDVIKDDNKRYTAAFEQVKYLCTLDQQLVFEKINTVVEHNYNHIMNTDWTQFAANQINQIVAKQT